MKKLYSKPQILFEDFSVSTSIAAGCEAIANSAPYSCAYYMANMRKNIFISTVNDCDYNEVNFTGFTSAENNDGVFNGLCYHVPNSNNNVFTSL